MEDKELFLISYFDIDDDERVPICLVEGLEQAEYAVAYESVKHTAVEKESITIRHYEPLTSFRVVHYMGKLAPIGLDERGTPLYKLYLEYYHPDNKYEIDGVKYSPYNTCSICQMFRENDSRRTAGILHIEGYFNTQSELNYSTPYDKIMNEISTHINKIPDITFRVTDAIFSCYGDAVELEDVINSSV